MLLSGFFVSGPLSLAVLSLAESAFPGCSTRAVVSKVALNGALAPIGLSLVFTSVALLEGKGWVGAREKLRSDLAATWLTNALFWPAVNRLQLRRGQAGVAAACERAGRARCGECTCPRRRTSRLRRQVRQRRRRVRWVAVPPAGVGA